MTTPRHEYCPNPDCPHEQKLKINDWFRKKLPDSDLGYGVTDLDFVITIRHQSAKGKLIKLIILEIKRYNKPIPYNQRETYNFLDQAIKKELQNGWDLIKSIPARKFRYYGFHTVTFENNFFDDGKCYWDDNEITENELIKKLSSLDEKEFTKYSNNETNQTT